MTSAWGWKSEAFTSSCIESLSFYDSMAGTHHSASCSAFQGCFLDWSDDSVSSFFFLGFYELPGKLCRERSMSFALLFALRTVLFQLSEVDAGWIPWL